MMIAVDWGTSSLRLWLLDGEGRAVAQSASAEGADTLDAAGFARVLLHHCAQLGGPADAPVVMCGMVGSRSGWREAPYVPVPAAPQEIARHAVRVRAGGMTAHILPGLAQHGERAPDVMRGEETQLLGLVRAAPGFEGPGFEGPGFEGIVCMPGTHSKWVTLARGAITSFRTAMTGELYALLSRQSVLRHVIGPAAAGEPEAGAFEAGAFDAGVRDGIGRPERVFADLFAIRAAGLLHGQTGAAAAARLSGLLIGAELGLNRPARAEGRPVALIAAGPLASLYRRAFAIGGIAFEAFDAGAMVRGGLFEAAKGLAAE